MQLCGARGSRAAGRCGASGKQGGSAYQAAPRLGGGGGTSGRVERHRGRVSTQSMSLFRTPVGMTTVRGSSRSRSRQASTCRSTCRLVSDDTCRGARRHPGKRRAPAGAAAHRVHHPAHRLYRVGPSLFGSPTTRALANLTCDGLHCSGSSCLGLRRQSSAIQDAVQHDPERVRPLTPGALQMDASTRTMSRAGRRWPALASRDRERHAPRRGPGPGAPGVGADEFLILAPLVASPRTTRRSRGDSEERMPEGGGRPGSVSRRWCRFSTAANRST
jgi:hypothetical protein